MDKNTVERAIKAFDTIDPLSKNAFDEATSIFRSVGKLPAILDSMDVNTRLCRTRTHWKDVFYKSIEEIATPKPQYVSRFGRCNKPSTPIFYCSENRKTSYAELIDYWLDNKHAGQHVYATISSWYTKRPMNLIIVASPDIQERVSTYDKYYGKALDEQLSQMTSHIREAYIIYHRYLFDKFKMSAKHDPHPYIITSAYSALALSKAGNLADGIMYPSVPYLRRGLNFALRPEFINTANIELRFVLRNKFIRVDNQNSLPDFKEVEAIQAQSIQNSGIDW